MLTLLRFGPTASRSILGCLNEAEFVLSRLLHQGMTLEDAEGFFSQFIYSTTGYRRPIDLVQELVAQTVI